MKTMVLLGLGEFNQQLLEELLRFPDVDIILLDSDSENIEHYKERVKRAYIADAGYIETIRKVVPRTTYAAVVDLGERSEAAVLAVNCLRQIRIERIIAKADTPGFAETLRAVGATQVVEPEVEVAQRISPPLLLQSMNSYVPISQRLVVSEVIVPSALHGETMLSGKLRRVHHVNVVGVRKGPGAVYSFPDPSYVFAPDDALMVVGTREDIAKLAGGEVSALAKLEKVSFFRRLLPRADRRGRR